MVSMEVQPLSLTAGVLWSKVRKLYMECLLAGESAQEISLMSA